jgi:hypothetical protein
MPPNARPVGPVAETKAAATRATMAAIVKAEVARLWKAPQTSRARAETIRISSGRAKATASGKVAF